MSRSKDLRPGRPAKIRKCIHCDEKFGVRAMIFHHAEKHKGMGRGDPSAPKLTPGRKPVLRKCTLCDEYHGAREMKVHRKEVHKVRVGWPLKNKSVENVK